MLKFAHIAGAAILFGTGIGIAFFMLWSHRSGEVAAIAVTARGVVIADLVFTATAVVAQPVTGTGLALLSGVSPGESWLLASLVLYALVGACWLPVVRLQIGMRDMAIESAAAGTPLPAKYATSFRRWTALGWPAFAGVLAIYWLMIAKPALW